MSALSSLFSVPPALVSPGDLSIKKTDEAEVMQEDNIVSTSGLSSLFSVPPALVGPDQLAVKKEISDVELITAGSHAESSQGACHLKPVQENTAANNGKGEIKLNNTPEKKKKKKKKKKQNKPQQQVHKYIDYDKKLEDDVKRNDSCLREWNNSAASSSTNFKSNIGQCLTAQQREVISYKELTHTRPQCKAGGGTQGQVNHNPVQQNYKKVAPPMKRKSDPMESPKKIPRMNFIQKEILNVASSSKISPVVSYFIDPLVAATEKKPIFEKPQLPADQKVRKPLTNKQKKKIEKAKYYKEKLRLQMEKEKERVSNQKQLQCRFFSFGNCAKGAECPYSHDFIPPKKQELCKFYVMSFCEKGSSCLYYHGDFPCKFYHFYHSCTQGDACRFSHQALTDETKLLLEKSINDVSQVNGQTDKILTTEASNNATSGNPVETMPTSDLYNDAVHQHEAVPGQMGLDVSSHEPWNVKLKPIDLDLNHRPQLPPGVNLYDLMATSDPRAERYQATNNALINGTASVNGTEKHFNGNLYIGTNHEPITAIHDQKLNNGLLADSELHSCNDLSPSNSGQTAAMTALPHLLSSTSSGFPESNTVNSNPEELKKVARHFSLPATHIFKKISANNGKRLIRNKLTGEIQSPVTSGMPLPSAR